MRDEIEVNGSMFEWAGGRGPCSVQGVMESTIEGGGSRSFRQGLNLMVPPEEEFLQQTTLDDPPILSLLLCQNSCCACAYGNETI